MPKLGLIKNSFFSQIPVRSKEIHFNDVKFNLNGFSFEFLSLYRLFISNKRQLKSDSELTLYLKYLCDLLIRYYRNDYVRNDLNYFIGKRKELDDFLDAETGTEHQKQKNNFSSFLFDGLRNNLLKGASSFTSISVLRDCISKLNSNRSHWNYSRKLANHAVIYYTEYGSPDLIMNINQLVGHDYSPDDFTKLLDKSQDILPVLSVGLYALRFISNLLPMTKHLAQALINKNLSSRKVAVQEIEKRGFTMMSDLVWAVTNLFTNYKDTFQLSTQMASGIVITSLVFDATLFIVRWSFESNKYGYCHRELIMQKNNTTSELELSVINRQLDILCDEREAQSAYYKINILAAKLLILSFGTTLIISTPHALSALTTVSMLGNALYNSAVEYKKYRQSSIAVQREITNGKILDNEHHRNLLIELNHECNQAKSNFWTALSLNTLATAFIITASAISWPIALSVTISYMVFRLHDAYEKNSKLNDYKRAESYNIYRLFGASELGKESQLSDGCLLKFIA